MQATRGAPLTRAGDQPPLDAPDTSGTSSASPRIGLCAVVFAVTYAADVVSKIVAVRLLSAGSDVVVVPGVLDLHLTRNPGAAFSVATGMTVLLSLLAVVVVVVLVRVAARLRDRTWAVALGLLLGGALGNLTDRLVRAPGPLRGHVVDFVQLPHWPVFNVADSSIVIAAVLIGWQSVRGVGVDGRG